MCSVSNCGGYLQIAEFTTAIPNSSFLLRNSYVWDPTEKIATRPLAWNSSTSQPSTSQPSTPQLLFYTHDGNKNVSEVIAANGTLAAHYEYAPFGALTAQRGTSAASNPWRFSSEYAEDDTATVYYNYRHYEPLAGRWTSRDPIGERGGASVYCYVVNRVILYADKLGLLFDFLKQCCCSICLYSAVDWKTYNSNEPLDFSDSMNAHTWIQYEGCDTDVSAYLNVNSDEMYSFGPDGFRRNEQLIVGVPGIHWPVDEYVQPYTNKVVKKCWKMNGDCCRKFKNKLRSRDKYPKLFNLSNYCTSSSLNLMNEFLKDGCIDSVPDGKGELKLPNDVPSYLKKFLGSTVTASNPKDLAKELEEGGGTSLWPEIQSEEKK